VATLRMLSHANVLTEGSSRTLAADDVWGEELVHQSLATAWYPADWDSVTDDELVFLLPSLCNSLPASHDRHEPALRGPIDYLTRTLTPRADAVAHLLARRSGLTEPTAAAEIGDRLVRSGLLSSIEARRHSSTLRDSLEPTPGREQGRPPDWLIAELVALAYTNRMLSDALGNAPPQGAVHAPLIDWPLTLTDVVVASISARLNGAYVYPEHAYAHELLALAALLGHLVAGRTAYLPPSIAGTLLDILRSRPSADDETSAVLRTYIEWAGGANRLMLWARIIHATGVARRITPRGALVPRAMRAAWNARLLQRLDALTLWPSSIDRN
jgi:hypothetical protein